MTYQVLFTKLYNPPRKPGLVQRPRLLQRLEDGYNAGKHVTLISAPAGFGKTTIISEWITANGADKSFGWVSLDEGDNDPVRFLIYMITALQKANKEIGRSILNSLQSLQAPILTDLLESLINEISTVSKPFLIVLDDYHLIKKIEVHSLVQLLLKRQPELLHLVIITREDPPLPLPRLRVLGQITEIREKDLRFSLPEAQAFLVKTMGLDLTSEDVGKLKERTEGWAAGMQLAALALEEFQDMQERHAFIEAFAGSNRLVVDYLISEVLLHQPETTRQFLLCTSILERFCAELCEKVIFDDSEIGHSQMILQSIEQGNMFLVPLDNQRHWYRYHHLFSEMLYHSLRRSIPEQIPALHRRASEWFETQGLFPEAVKHATAFASTSGEWDFARALLDRHAMAILFQGQSSLVMGWCREFPKSYLEKAPEICIYYAWSLVLTFRMDYLDAVEEKLKWAEQALENSSQPAHAPVGQDGAPVPLRPWVTGQICVIRSQILLGGFQTLVDPQEEISLSLKGLELLPEGENSTRAICQINLAHAQTMQNNPLEAYQAFEEALPLMLSGRNYLTGATAIFYQARIVYYLGQLDRAEALCRNWKVKFAEIASGSDADNGEIPAARGLDIVLGLLLLERNQLEEAERLLVQALDLLGWASWMELHGFILLANLRLLSGNLAGAQETLQRMARLGPQHSACAEALQVLFEVKRSIDDPRVRSRAEAWAQKYTPQFNERLALGIGPYHCDAEYFYNLAWSRVQITLGHYQEAGVFISPALKSARVHGLPYRVAELSIEQALIQQGLGNPSVALADLDAALEIAEKAGYVRAFDHSPQLDRLLHRAIGHNRHGLYARQLLTTFNRLDVQARISSAMLPKRPGSSDLVELLSDREIEILGFLASGLAPTEVAKRLYLSPHTLKAHSQNIYAKLDVHSRIEAINKARELGII